MRRERDIGYCLVTNKQGGSWHLPIEQYEPVRTAWLKGVQFVDTFGFHGDRMTMKLADVDSISAITPEHIASWLAEKRADDADDSIAATT